MLDPGQWFLRMADGRRQETTVLHPPGGGVLRLSRVTRCLEGSGRPDDRLDVHHHDRAEQRHGPDPRPNAGHSAG